MKKFFKIIGILLLLLIVGVLVAGLILPKDVTVERSTVINAPPEAVFEQMVLFRNTPNWSPFLEQEPTAVVTYQGQDGTVGSSYSWVGKDLGEGTMTNTGVQGTEMKYDLHFVKPMESKASGFLKAESAGPGKTKATWNLLMHYSFPMNVMQLFPMMENSFDRGLQRMKEHVEKNPQVAATTGTVPGMTRISQVTYPATHYAIIRKTVGMAGLSDFYAESFGKLGQAVGDKIQGNGVGIIYSWNDAKMEGDMGAGFPVDKSVTKVEGAQLVDVAESSAYMATYTGGYYGTSAAHQALAGKVAADGKKQNLVIEEYVISPDKEKDSTRWVTKIYYLTK